MIWRLPVNARGCSRSRYSPPPCALSIPRPLLRLRKAWESVGDGFTLAMNMCSCEADMSIRALFPCSTFYPGTRLILACVSLQVGAFCDNSDLPKTLDVPAIRPRSTIPNSPRRDAGSTMGAFVQTRIGAADPDNNSRLLYGIPKAVRLPVLCHCEARLLFPSIRHSSFPLCARPWPSFLAVALLPSSLMA